MPDWQVDKDRSWSSVAIPVDSMQAGQTIRIIGGGFLHSHLADRLNDSVAFMTCPYSILF